jgi:hypothetical protein
MSAPEHGIDYGVELIAWPTGWQSIPGLVRLVVWIWAVATVVSLVLGVVAGAITGIALMAGLAG